MIFSIIKLKLNAQIESNDNSLRKAFFNEDILTSDNESVEDLNEISETEEHSDIYTVSDDILEYTSDILMSDEEEDYQYDSDDMFTFEKLSND